MSELEIEEVIPLSCDLCDNCEQVYSITYTTDGKDDREWACVGLIKEPREEKDVHDALNKIRVCIEKDIDKITSHEWTPYEAHSISLLLNMAVNIHLREGQPTVELINELLKNGYTDRKANEKEEQ